MRVLKDNKHPNPIIQNAGMQALKVTQDRCKFLKNSCLTAQWFSSNLWRIMATAFEGEFSSSADDRLDWTWRQLPGVGHIYNRKAGTG